MSILSKDYFTIETRHLESGLTAEDFSAIAGAPAQVVSLSALPHWDKVEQSAVLSAAEIKERTAAVQKIFSTSGQTPVACFDFDPFDISGQRTIEQIIATSATSSVYLPYRQIGAFSSMACQLEKLKDGTDKRKTFTDDQTKRRFVYPYSFRPRCEIAEMSVPNAPLFFLSPFCLSKQVTWSHLTGLPEELIHNYPKDNFVDIMSQLHEAAHSIQLTVPTRGGSVGFDKECDADLFALRSVSQSRGGQEASKAWVHARYLHILSCSRTYWFAPHLDAGVSHVEPPSHNKIREAGEEVRRQFLIAHSGIVKRTLLKALPDLATDLYDGWKKENHIRKPTTSFPVLRKITEAGVFKKNPLAQDMACKILGAAEYFSPGLTKSKPRMLTL